MSCAIFDGPGLVPEESFFYYCDSVRMNLIKRVLCGAINSYFLFATDAGASIVGRISKRIDKRMLLEFWKLLRE